MTDTNASTNAVAEAYGIEWMHRREPDRVRHAALGLAVDHHRRRIGDPPDVHDVLATADAFVAWLRGGETDAP